MDTRTKTMLAFMTDAPDGTYEAPKPTDEQFAAVLPWLIDQVVTWAHKGGHCDTVNQALSNVVLGQRRTGEVNFYSAAGLDIYGFDRNGFNKDGFNRNGWNKDGFNRYGFDRDGYNVEGYSERGFNRDGFNKDGLDRYGQTREQAIAKLVAGWTPAHLALVQTKLQERAAAAEATKIAEQAATVTDQLVTADA
jgi:hypothetical protein